MNKSALLASTAVALVLCAASATAQTQQEKQAPGQNRESGPTQERPAQRTQEPEQGQSGQKRDQSARERPQGQEGKGAAQTEPREKGKAGTAQKAPESRETPRKGAEQTTEPKGKQGTAEKAGEPREKSGKAAEPNKAPAKEKAAEQNKAPAKEKSAGAEPKGGRAQLSEQQRTDVHQKFKGDRNLNRATNVNFSINVGTRVPRSVRLVAVPVAILAIVPQYRDYRYFAYNDEICIVEPTTYEIVEVIRVQGSTVAGGSRLMLSDAERAIILREVDLRDDSTLGLGALSEGSDVPRDVRAREFPLAVVDQVPKLKGYRFFTAEQRVAIVDADGRKIELVISDRR